MNTMMIYVIGVGLKMIPVSAWHDADDPWWDGYDGQSILMLMDEHGYRESTLSDEVDAMFDHFANALGRQRKGLDSPERCLGDGGQQCITGVGDTT